MHIGQRQHFGDQLADRTAGDQVEERPGTLAMLVDDAGIGEQLEMAGDARLRLPEDVGEIGDGELAMLQQRHDPQPGRLVERPQDIEERWQRKGHGQ